MPFPTNRMWPDIIRLPSREGWKPLVQKQRNITNRQTFKSVIPRRGVSDFPKFTFSEGHQTRNTQLCDTEHQLGRIIDRAGNILLGSYLPEKTEIGARRWFRVSPDLTFFQNANRSCAHSWGHLPASPPIKYTERICWFDRFGRVLVPVANWDYFKQLRKQLCLATRINASASSCCMGLECTDWYWKYASTRSCSLS